MLFVGFFSNSGLHFSWDGGSSSFVLCAAVINTRKLHKSKVHLLVALFICSIELRMLVNLETLDGLSLSHLYSSVGSPYCFPVLMLKILGLKGLRHWLVSFYCILELYLGICLHIFFILVRFLLKECFSSSCGEVISKISRCLVFHPILQWDNNSHKFAF